MLNPTEKIVSDIFHTMYYHSTHTWNGGITTWMGVPVLQNPLDMWILQEIIFETKPDVIIETGSCAGGSALFLVTIFPKLEVISIDTGELDFPKFEHKRIWWKCGRSTDKTVLMDVKKAVKDKKIMVMLDSDHTDKNVLAEMEAYGQMVSSGCYMVVCDTNLGGNPVHNNSVKGPGPMKAVEKYFEKHHDFEIDQTKEKFYMTFFPNGWLRKK